MFTGRGENYTILICIVLNTKGNCPDRGCCPGRTCRLLLRTCINIKMAHIQSIQTFQKFNESTEKTFIPSNIAQPETKSKILGCILITDTS